MENDLLTDRIRKFILQFHGEGVPSTGLYGSVFGQTSQRRYKLLIRKLKEERRIEVKKGLVYWIGE